MLGEALRMMLRMQGVQSTAEALNKYSKQEQLHLLAIMLYLAAGSSDKAMLVNELGWSVLDPPGTSIRMLWSPMQITQFLLRALITPSNGLMAADICPLSFYLAFPGYRCNRWREGSCASDNVYGTTGALWI